MEMNSRGACFNGETWSCPRQQFLVYDLVYVLRFDSLRQLRESTTPCARSSMFHVHMVLKSCELFKRRLESDVERVREKTDDIFDTTNSGTESARTRASSKKIDVAKLRARSRFTWLYDEGDVVLLARKQNQCWFVCQVHRFFLDGHSLICHPDSRIAYLGLSVWANPDPGPCLFGQTLTSPQFRQCPR